MRVLIIRKTINFTRTICISVCMDLFFYELQLAIISLKHGSFVLIYYKNVIKAVK
jgi:hypothetical protein